MGEHTPCKLIKALPLCSSFNISLCPSSPQIFPLGEKSLETVDKEVLDYLQICFIDPHVLKT